MRRWLVTLAELIRALTGEDDYDRYLKHWSLHHTGEEPLSRRDFYVRSLEEKWSGINRCC